MVVKSPVLDQNGDKYYPIQTPLIKCAIKVNVDKCTKTNLILSIKSMWHATYRILG